MRFAEKLLALREEKRLSQAELGEAIGASGPTIHRWEKGVGGPTLAQAIELAKRLGVSLDQLAYDGSLETAGALSVDERAIVDLFRALRLEKDEALRRLAGYEATGQAWTPGSVRDLTASEAARQRERSKGGSVPQAPGPIPLKDLLIGQRNHLPPEEAEKPPGKAPRKKREG